MVLPAVESCLRRKRGVRRDDLAEVIDADLARRMHVDLGGGHHVVLATAAWQLDRLIKRTFSQARDQVLLSAAYNIERDPTLTPLALTNRIAVFGERHRLAVSTLNSKLSELTSKRMRFALDQPFPVPDQGVIREQAALEAEYARDERAGAPPALVVVHSTDLTRLLAGGGRREFAALALRGQLHFEATKGDDLVTVHTDLGEYLCAFTGAAQLREYREAVGSPIGNRDMAEPGYRVVEVLVEHGIGLALNPPAGPGAPVGAGEFWTAAELAALREVRGA
ncbi:hypothetical protein JOD54_001050 [Actinokineospora baliensis]|uniref:hypothetical protein n=1 Tax=Actinokineospora baliensis TaxID=547056 RepID=UPI001958B9A2|nr:hypothetical protein [Actinokineospora baliensis]MBM7770846.1 hypothetical protein [Actinokineospora baliensis]